MSGAFDHVVLPFLDASETPPADSRTVGLGVLGGLENSNGGDQPAIEAPQAAIETPSLGHQSDRGASPGKRPDVNTVDSLLCMPLANFARDDRLLEVRLTWWPVTLWFVPDERDAVLLVAEGVSRGRIWTAGELLDLLSIPGLTGDQLITIATAKVLFSGTLDRVREHSDPGTSPIETDALSLWPDMLPGLGPRHIGPFDPCADCEARSWARYGSTVLCLTCARRRSDTPDLGQESRG
jgi:hypothetical protein